MLWYDKRDWKNAVLDTVSHLPPPSLPKKFIDMLNDGISGDVFWPASPGYGQQRHVSNPVFNNFPTVIVMCETDADVALCLEVARESGFPAVVRSGGHSTAGFSSPDNTIVINVRRMTSIEISEDGSHVWVGAGCDFGTLNTALEARDLHTPGGACPNVCIGGYMQGGGYGFTARIFGMNCDQVIEAEIMGTDGTIHRVGADTNPDDNDLFWAIRGGTGSNFGVLLRVCYKLQPTAQFSGFSIRWDISSDKGVEDAATALNWLQENYVKSELSKDLGYQMIWVFEGPEDQPRKPYLLMRGMYNGPRKEMLSKLSPVLGLEGAVLEYEFAPLPYSILNRILLTTPYEVPQFPSSVKAEQSAPPESKLSRILARVLEPNDWKALIEFFVRSPNPYTTIAMEIYGGAINEVPEGESAFVHRNDYCDIFCDVFWLQEDQREPAHKFIKEWENLIAPYWDGAVYQNYPRVEDNKFSSEFWTDEAYDRLVRTKNRLDPDNVLRFAQSIGS